MRRKPTLSDIARESGTSIATVSRALSQPALVHVETRERVRAVAARLGYVPDRRARALASGRSGAVGVVVPTLNSPIFSETLQALQRVLSGDGYQMLVASHEYDVLAEAMALAELVSQGVEALVVVGAERPAASWDAIAAAGVPLMQLWEGTSRGDRVVVDNLRAGRLVAEHLLDLGHNRIAVIAGVLANNDRQSARVAGIRAAMADRGLALPRTMVSEQPLTLAAGRSACMTLLETVPRPTAIIGTADLLAIGAMIEAQGRGIAVPAALSVAGIDNVDIAAHLAPSLSTVDIPAAAIGAEAARMLLRRIAGGQTGAGLSLELPVDLVIRHSTASPG